jgi:DNA-binding MarR family transcriptional regulator
MTQGEPTMVIPAHVIRYNLRAEKGVFDPSNAKTFFLVKALAQQMRDVTCAWLEPFGLHSSSFNVLSFLRAAPGRSMALSAISRSLHTRPATVTSLIDGLEREGLIVRKAHAEDRRTTLALLTNKGANLIDRAARVHHGHVNSVMRGISAADRETAFATLLRISEGLTREKGSLRGGVDARAGKASARPVGRRSPRGARHL